MSRAIVRKYRKGTGREGVKFFKKKPIFLIDSTDFKIKGFHHIPKTNKLWSYKLNGPGRRYQLLTDGNGVPLKI